MIKSEELRIGNYVLGHGCECYIHGHDIHIMQCGVLYNEPIPITSEVLERCGFVKSNEFDSYRLNEFDIEIIFGKWHWVVDDRGDNEGTTPRKVDYLHQLQNIYFAITGKELDYEPS